MYVGSAVRCAGYERQTTLLRKRALDSSKLMNEKELLELNADLMILIREKQEQGTLNEAIPLQVLLHKNLMRLRLFMALPDQQMPDAPEGWRPPPPSSSALEEKQLRSTPQEPSRLLLSRPRQERQAYQGRGQEAQDAQDQEEEEQGEPARQAPQPAATQLQSRDQAPSLTSSAALLPARQTPISRLSHPGRPASSASSLQQPTSGTPQPDAHYISKQQKPRSARTRINALPLSPSSMEVETFASSKAPALPGSKATPVDGASSGGGASDSTRAAGAPPLTARTSTSSPSLPRQSGRKRRLGSEDTNRSKDGLGMLLNVGMLHGQELPHINGHVPFVPPPDSASVCSSVGPCARPGPSLSPGRRASAAADPQPLRQRPLPPSPVAFRSAHGADPRFPKPHSKPTHVKGTFGDTDANDEQIDVEGEFRTDKAPQRRPSLPRPEDGNGGGAVGAVHEDRPTGEDRRILAQPWT